MIRVTVARQEVVVLGVGPGLSARSRMERCDGVMRGKPLQFRIIRCGSPIRDLDLSLRSDSQQWPRCRVPSSLQTQWIFSFDLCLWKPTSKGAAVRVPYRLLQTENRSPSELTAVSTGPFAPTRDRVPTPPPASFGPQEWHFPFTPGCPGSCSAIHLWTTTQQAQSTPRHRIESTVVVIIQASWVHASPANPCASSVPK